MLKDNFEFAWTNLIHKKLRSWLTLLGIFIGVLSVVALISLGDGLRTAVTSQFGISSTEVISVQAGGIGAAGPPGSAVVNPLVQDDVDAIGRLSSIERAIPRFIQQGKLEFNDILVFGYAMSIPDGENRKFTYDVLEVETESGRLLRDGDNKKVVLGYNFGADKVGLEKPVRVGHTVIIENVKFEVIGIVEKKGSFIFDNMVLMNEIPLKDLFDIDDEVNIIAVQVKDKDKMDEAKLDIEKVLRKQRDVKKGEEDFEVTTPEAALSTVNDVLVGVTAFIAMVASISILVGAIGIVNTMKSSVLERKSQIGVMKAIGAKNSDVFLQFFIESGLMGLIGGLMGVIFGVLIGYLGTIGINNFVGADIQPAVNWILVIITLFASFLIGSIAGIVPAMQAAKEHPVEALRG